VAVSLDAAPAIVRVRYLLERGRTLNSSGKRDEARPLFEEAWELARQSGLDGFAVDAAHMVAIVTSPDESLRWNEIGLDLARESEDPRARRWRGSLLNNLGWTRHDGGDFARALSLFEEALAARREEGTVRQVEIARWCVARCLRSLGRIDEALAAQRSLAADMEARGADEDGYVSEELGECLLSLGRPDEARPYFARAYRALGADPWLAEKEPARIARWKDLGGVMVETK
jgi:tetratricopeptide (TPR) repeat protein